jgi:hypothetical protein
MKQKFVFFMLAAIVAAGCSSDNEEKTVLNGSAVETSVLLTFSPYEVDAMTRTATSISNYCTHLDVWITDGESTTSVHQSSSDSDFGSLSVTLDKTKTYTLYAVAHKCASDATLADGIVSFPDDKVTHSMFYTTTFSPATTTSLSCEMQRIVAMFRLETTDAVPAECKKVRFTISDVFDRWNVTAGGTHHVNRVSTVSITSTANDGTVAISIYAIATDAQTLHTVTAEALNESDDVIQSRVFENVPLRNGYKTTYRGTFFTDTDMTMTFTVADWNEYETVNF